MEIAPGLPVALVVGTDHRRQTPLTLNSMVYEATGEIFVLAQTTPPLGKDRCGGDLTVTYLTERQDGPARYAFPAAILDFVDHYRPASGPETQALRIKRKGEPAPYSIRSCIRVKPTPGSRLSLYVQYEKAMIVDISLGGVRFNCDSSVHLDAGASVVLRFDVAGKDYPVEATILRMWHGKGRRSFMVAEFQKSSGPFQHALARMIHAIERDARGQNPLCF